MRPAFALQFQRLVAVVVLPMHLAACTSWRLQEIAPAQLIEQEQPEKIRVTRTSGSQVVLENPAISGDMLTGLRDDGVSVSIPVSSIEAVALRQPDTGKTVGAVALSVVLVAGVVLVIGYLELCVSQDIC